MFEIQCPSWSMSRHGDRHSKPLVRNDEEDKKKQDLTDWLEQVHYGSCCSDDAENGEINPEHEDDKGAESQDCE